jgi:hypothetical protein
MCTETHIPNILLRRSLSITVSIITSTPRSGQAAKALRMSIFLIDRLKSCRMTHTTMASAAGLSSLIKSLAKNWTRCSSSHFRNGSLDDSSQRCQIRGNHQSQVPRRMPNNPRTHPHRPSYGTVQDQALAQRRDDIHWSCRRVPSRRGPTGPE